MKKATNKLGIDEKACKERSFLVGELVDGMTIPNIFCILGTVIMELVLNARAQGYDIDGTFKGWLQSLIDRIDKLPKIDKDSQKIAN